MTVLLLCVVLYVLGVVTTGVALYILACREYKRKHEIRNFNHWYDDEHAEDIVYSSFWPFFWIATAISAALDFFARRIRRKFNIR